MPADFVLWSTICPQKLNPQMQPLWVHPVDNTSSSILPEVEDAAKSSFINNMLYGVVVYEEQLTGSLPYEFDITWLHGSSPENRISCEMLPPTSKAHRGRVSFISPARKSSGSELSKELEKNSHWLCCPFFSLFPYLELFAVVDTTGLYYRLFTFHSCNWWEALPVTKKKKKFHPVAWLHAGSTLFTHSLLRCV